jgi:hypothetical protein
MFGIQGVGASPMLCPLTTDCALAQLWSDLGTLQRGLDVICNCLLSPLYGGGATPAPRQHQTSWTCSLGQARPSPQDSHPSVLDPGPPADVSSQRLLTVTKLTLPP